MKILNGGQEKSDVHSQLCNSEDLVVFQQETKSEDLTRT